MTCRSRKDIPGPRSPRLKKCWGAVPDARRSATGKISQSKNRTEEAGSGRASAADHRQQPGFDCFQLFGRLETQFQPLVETIAFAQNFLRNRSILFLGTLKLGDLFPLECADHV